MRIITTLLSGALATTAAVAQQAPPAVAPPATTALASPQQVTTQPALPGIRPRAAAQPQAPGAVPKRAPINGVLVLYGNERCPTNTDGDEIVICERRSAQEQYRVPKELREFVVTPQNESWANRAQGTLGPAGSGVDTIGSCSAVGAGGNLGCMGQDFRAAKAERRAAKAAEPVIK